MADLIGELVVQITGDTKKFDKSVDTTRTKTTELNKDFKKLGDNALKFATLPILAIGTAMVKTAIDIEKQKTAFGVLLKDVDKGNQLFTDLQKLASKTPLQLDSITKSAQQLLASGSDMNSLNATITMLGDIALGDAQKLGTLTNAYSKMQTKGKATMEELNMVTEAGVPILQALADSLGVSVASVFDLSSKGKIGFTDVQKAMASLTSETGQFNKGMEKLSETTGGKLSTALDNIKISASEFGVILLPSINNILEATTELFKGFSELDEGTKRIILGFAGVTAGIAPAIKVVGAFGNALKVLSLPKGGIGLAIVAVGALVGLIATLQSARIAELENTFGNVSKSTGIASKDLGKIADSALVLVTRADSIAQGFDNAQKMTGLNKNQLADLLLASGKLTKEQETYINKLTQTALTTDELIALSKKNLETVKTTTVAVGGLSDEQLQADITQNEAVQGVINSNKTRLEQIDEEIENINKLALKDGEFKDDQLKATKILQDEKEKILDEDVKNKEKAILDELLAQQAFDAETRAILEKARDDRKKNDEDEAKSKADRKKKELEDAKKLTENIINLSKQAFTVIDGLAKGQAGATAEAGGDMLSSIGQATGIMQLQIAGAVISAVGGIITAYEDARKEAERITDALAKETASILDKNQREWLVRERDNRITAINETEKLALDAFIATLTAQEIAQLRTDGVLTESTLERLNREKIEAIEAGDAILASQIQNELDIANIRQTAINDTATAEKIYKNAINKMNYEIAVAEIESKIAVLKADKATALADMWWNSDARDTINSSYGTAISTLQSVSIPPPIALATGAFIQGSSRGTSAILGEAGDEEVFGMGSQGIPRRSRFAKEVAGMVMSEMGNSNSGTVVNINSLYPPSRTDLDKLAEDLYISNVKVQQRRGVM